MKRGRFVEQVVSPEAVARRLAGAQVLEFGSDFFQPKSGPVQKVAARKIILKMRPGGGSLCG